MARTRTAIATLAGVAALAVACAAPSDPEPPPQPATVRDSAGVTIVESATPMWRRANPSPGRLAPRPHLVLAWSESAPEQSPVDPVGVLRTASGEIVVADGNRAGWQRLLVYDAEGRFLRHLGRRGEGPCEFMQVWRLEPYPGDSVAVFDMGRRSVVILGLDGGCGGSIALPTSPPASPDRMRAGAFVGGVEGVFPDGTVLAYPMSYVDSVPAAPGPMWYRPRLLRLDRSGATVAELGSFRLQQQHWDGTRVAQLHYGHVGARALDGFDVIHGEGPGFELLRYDSTGALTQVIRRAFTPQPVSDEDRVVAVTMRVVSGGSERAARPGPSAGASRSGAQAGPDPAALRERIARAHWATHKPPFLRILVAPSGHIWVEHYRLASPGLETDTTDPARWSVFNRAGEWLGEVDVPASLHIRRVYEDAVMGIQQDDDGTTAVVVYPILR